MNLPADVYVAFHVLKDYPGAPCVRQMLPQEEREKTEFEITFNETRIQHVTHVKDDAIIMLRYENENDKLTQSDALVEQGG